MLEFEGESLSLKRLKDLPKFQKDARRFFERVQIPKSFSRFRNIVVDELKSDMRHWSNTREIGDNVTKTVGRVRAGHLIMAQLLSIACTGTRNLFTWRGQGWSLMSSNAKFEGFFYSSGLNMSRLNKVHPTLTQKMDAISRGDFPHIVLSGATLMIELTSNRLGTRYFRYTLGTSDVLDYPNVQVRGERENDKGFKNAILSKNGDVWELSIEGDSHKIVDIVTDKPVPSPSAMSPGKTSTSTDTHGRGTNGPGPDLSMIGYRGSPPLMTIPINVDTAIATLKKRGWEVTSPYKWSIRSSRHTGNDRDHTTRIEKVWDAYISYHARLLEGCAFLIKWTSGIYLCKVVGVENSTLTCEYQDGETQEYELQNTDTGLYLVRMRSTKKSEVLDVVFSGAMTRYIPSSAATKSSSAAMKSSAATSSSATTKSSAATSSSATTSVSATTKSSSAATSVSAATKWEYLDNDVRTYKPYDDDQNKEISKVASGADFPKDVIVVDSLKKFGIKKIMLTSRDEGQQIGNYTTRTIRRIGFIGPQGTVRPNSGGASATSTSTSSTTLGSSTTVGSSPVSSTNYDALCAKATDELRRSGIPDIVSQALAKPPRNGEAPVGGNWEWTPPFEMMHNRPEGFSAQQTTTYDTLEHLKACWEDPLDLWEYSEKHGDAVGERFYNAMYHCRASSRPSYFAGFFRFSGGRGPSLFINKDGSVRPGDDDFGIVGHLLRKANDYAGMSPIAEGTVRTNVVYHAAPRDTLTSISRGGYKGSFNNLGVHGIGTYFAMGPFVDYCMGNSSSGINYATHNGSSGRFVYVMVCHAVTRPSLNTTFQPKRFVNGFRNPADFNKYVSAGTCGGQHDLLSNKPGREVIYGDLNINHVVYPIGIAAFKQR